MTACKQCKRERPYHNMDCSDPTVEADGLRVGLAKVHAHLEEATGIKHEDTDKLVSVLVTDLNIARKAHANNVLELHRADDLVGDARRERDQLAAEMIEARKTVAELAGRLSDEQVRALVEERMRHAVALAAISGMDADAVIRASGDPLTLAAGLR